MLFIKNLLSILYIFLFCSNMAFSDVIFSKSGEQTFLKVDQAFKVKFLKKSNFEKGSFHIIDFQIAEGYYLYKDKIKILLNGQELENIKFPKTKTKEDEFFGKSEIYDNDFILNIVSDVKIKKISITYQGCAERGLCYPPVKKTIFPDSQVDYDSNLQKVSEQDQVYEKLLNNNIFTSLILFIGFGLLLSLTPCVLPMVPILSGIIIKSSKKDELPFLLSLNYVLGLCSVYLVVGIFIGYSTDLYNIQSIFQEPIYLILFSIILILLALSMFGLYEISIPSKIVNLFSKFGSENNKGGYTGSYLMGLFSALIVGPCIAPPLAGIFIYITSENPGPIITGLLFLSLSIGMSIPLLFYGTYMGNFIPKTGKWMKYINYLFGILLLIVALSFIDRIIPITNFFNDQKNLVSFQKVSNIKELKEQLLTDNKIKLIDVYADWCVECKWMELRTFTNENVRVLLKKYHLIKIDVTENSKDDKEMLKFIGVVGPPAYKFYNINGDEIKGFSIQGFMNSEKFKKHLEELENY